MSEVDFAGLRLRLMRNWEQLCWRLPGNSNCLVLCRHSWTYQNHMEFAVTKYGDLVAG